MVELGLLHGMDICWLVVVEIEIFWFVMLEPMTLQLHKNISDTNKKFVDSNGALMNKFYLLEAMIINYFYGV
jgi:hypothetical protein